MNVTNKLFVIAGAALGLSASAFAADDANRALSAEMLSDSSSRASELGAAETYIPNIHGYLQFRYNWDYIRDSGVKHSAIGFQNARTVVSVGGNIANPNWGYYIQFDASDTSQAGGLEDAYGSYKLDNGWTLLWGQSKLPLLREELVGDTTQLSADRSSFNSFFTGGRSQGVVANYTADAFRFWGAFSDGARAANTDYVSQTEADYALTARGEYKWAGDWKQSNDFTSFQNQQFFGLVGGAIHFQDGGSTFASGTGRTTDTSILEATADVSVEGNGWNAFGAFAYRHSDPNSTPKLDDFGFMGQGGIFVQAQWELFGRFEYIRIDKDYGAPERNFSVLTLGTNYYFVPESHAAKFTFDWQYFFNKANGVVSPGTLGGNIGSGKKGEWSFQAQMQLVF
jgi:hypothetical protein